MIDVLLTIFWGLVLLTIIVFIHELGHFLAARAFGLRVKEFMIGLPGPKISFKRKETRYGVTAIPLGGYCLIAGMEKGEGEDELIKESLAFISYFGKVSEEEADKAAEQWGIDLVRGLDILADWGTVNRSKSKGVYEYTIAEASLGDKEYKEGEVRTIADPASFLAAEEKLTYNALPWWKRIVILLAGSFSNLLVAVVLLVVLLMTSGSYIATTTVDTVVDDSPAAAAGIAPGDTLVSVDGEDFSDWQGFITAIQEYEAGDKIELGYEHEGESLTANITLADNEGRPLVGVTSRTRPVELGDALQISVGYIGLVFDAILQLINPATFSETISETSSVVGISMEARSAADSGPLNFIMLIAALSISIGLMNMLPIPPLDGGKIIVETIERISRRRLPVSIINAISLAGLAAMLALFLFATNADIHRYFLGG